MPSKLKQRLTLSLLVIFLVSLGVAIILYNLNQTIIFFYPPSKLTSEMENKKIRVGGLVLKNSIKQISPNEVTFILTDNAANLVVYFKGIPPALFREEQGIVAEGKLNNNLFHATSLLTKHDENYYPPTSELPKN